MEEVYEVIVGIYEGYVCGYKLLVDKTSKIPTVQISKTFAGPLHTQSVRALATGSHYLASGGADDRVRVYDLKKRQEIRELLHHSGTVNSVVFVDNANYLITGGADGKIAFINTKKWQLDKVWEKAHKGGVTCISVHPEESLALSVGTDLVLKSWNLVNGRNIYTTNLKNKAQYGGNVENIRWSPNGDNFAITGARFVEVFSLDTGNVIKSHKLENRVTDLCWIGDADILVGQDSGEMFFFNIENDESNTIPAHDSRLKAMYYVEGLLATVSSAGDLSIWNISEDYTEITQLREYSLECRPTSLCIIETSKLGLSIDNYAEDYTKPNIEHDTDAEYMVNKSTAEEDRVIIEYENEIQPTMKGKQKHNSKRMEQSQEEAFKQEENFKGQNKLKVIEEMKSKGDIVNSKKTTTKKSKKKKLSNLSSMDFEITDDIEDCNDKKRTLEKESTTTSYKTSVKRNTMLSKSLTKKSKTNFKKQRKSL
ncbi:p21-activated protein kinase-interacting protein 1-like [Culicoides brevitarsis]|uniref:p21-activated protein kinase-interacting protein 1-like n=1 Tax=Culicoides brevitarsis TaxID=469753 RepID=UPI00307B114E